MKKSLPIGAFIAIAVAVWVAIGSNDDRPVDPITPTVTMGETIEVLFVGDIMLDRTVRTTILNRGFDYMFGDVKSIFEGVNIAIGNLEGTITENDSKSLADFDVLKFTFATSTAFDLRKLGFTGVSLANNHTLDFGADGLSDTEKYLQNADIFFFGSPLNNRGLSSRVIVKDSHICFVGYHELYDSDTESVIHELEELSNCDYTAVVSHWGAEYESEPTESQRRIAHSFIDAGADAVIGAHPHVVQPIEIYKDKAIFYSLGNFIFDQDFSLPTRQGLAVRLELTEQSQKFHLIGIEMKANKLYFPEKEAYKLSLDVIISELPSDLKTAAGVDGVLVLSR
jgi:gamma-polyglutamate biosynthesis protein CapA